MRTSGTGRVQNKGLSRGPKRHIWRLFPQWRPVEPSPVQGAEASQPPAFHFSLSTPSCHLSPLGVSARPPRSVTTQFGGAGSSPGPRRASGGSATGLALEKSRLSLRLLSPGITSSQAHIHPTIQGTAKGLIRGGSAVGASASPEGSIARSSLAGPNSAPAACAQPGLSYRVQKGPRERAAASPPCSPWKPQQQSRAVRGRGNLAAAVSSSPGRHTLPRQLSPPLPLKKILLLAANCKDGLHREGGGGGP